MDDLHETSLEYVKAINLAMTSNMPNWLDDRLILMKVISLLLLKIHQPKLDMPINQFKFHLTVLGFHPEVISNILKVVPYDSRINQLT